MARMINVEKSQYLTQNIETFTKNKVGQYAKFLDRNPIFITYLSINQAMSRTDVGTGGVESDVGPKSPIRFNQINGLPAFNLPELKPEIDFDDENGYDINIDINDAVLLPNTIVPKSGDYIIIKIPNSIEIACRVNAFAYNTIQSNDFYTFSADLKYTGSNLIQRFKPQIVEEYETIFDNIGTEDKCFIRTTDIDKIKAIGLLFNELRDLYKTNFWDRLNGTFVCKNNDEDPEHSGAWYYDKYLIRFIMESEIFVIENDEKTIALAEADITELSNQWYPRTLYRAVLKRDTAYLARFPYGYQVPIQKRLSVFVINGENVNTIYLDITDDYPLLEDHSDGLNSKFLYEYFPHGLIHRILDEDVYSDEIKQKYDPHDCWKLHENESEEQGKLVEYEEPEYEFTYLDEIVFNYLLGRKLDIDRKKLTRFGLQVNNYAYRMMPIILYIILEYYNSYFKSDSRIDL